MNTFRTLNDALDLKRKYALFFFLLSLALNVSSCVPGAPPTPVPMVTATLAPNGQVPTVLPSPSPNASPTSAPPRTPTKSAATPPSPAPTPTRASSPPSIELLSRLGGTNGAAVSVAGDYIYLSIGARFVVLDIRNPGEPKQVGQSALLPSYITSISIWKANAYITTRAAGVSIFNISNAKQPALVGGLPEVRAQQLVFAGDYVYGVDEAGFKIYRAADPTHWTLVSSIAYGGAAKQLAVVGKYAYVTGTALHIVDVSNPTQAREIGTYAGMENATDLAIIGNYAWVVTGYIWRGRTASGELHVVDISNPARPAQVNVFPFNQPPQRLMVANGFAYVGAYGDLHVLSIADPKSPREVSTYRASGRIDGLATVGTLLMIASSDGRSLQIVSIARPERVGALGSFYTPKGARQIAVTARYAYIADNKYGFLVMDILDRRAPLIVGQATEFFDGWGIALAGNYLYVSSGDSLRIMNLVNPRNAVQVGALPLPLNGVSRLNVVGNRAYVTGGKVFVVDISHPDAPKLISTLEFRDNQANDLAIIGHYAVIADTEALRIVDIADSTRLQEVGSLRLNGWPYAVGVAGNYAYVVTNQTGLHVVDIANISKPVEVSYIPANNMRDVTIAGALAWVSDDHVGLRALDVTNPRKPVEVDSFKTKLESNSATVVGDYIFVAEASGGIAILRINP